MWALYGIDVWGAYRVPLVEALVKRLAVEPRSWWRARQLGGDQWYGWSITNQQVAAVQDHLLLNTKATARQRVTIRPSEMAPRPTPQARPIPTNDEAAVDAAFAALG